MTRSGPTHRSIRRVAFSLAASITLAACNCDPVEPLKPSNGRDDPPPVPIDTPPLVEVCGTVPAVQSDVAPTVLVVLDRSGSMDRAASGIETRWQAAVGAVRTMARDHEDELAFGLMLFPSPLIRDGCAEGVVTVTPRTGNAFEITQSLNETFPEGATPTAASLRAAERALVDEGLSDGVPAAVVLATDGGPNCNPLLDVETCLCAGPPDFCEFGGQPQDICLDITDTVAAAESLFAAGVPTYVIGINATDEFGFVLDEIARLGGTARTTEPGQPRFYPASDQAQLGSALDDVRVRIERCQRTVQAELVEATDIEVIVDGEPVEQGGPDGYTVTADGKVALTGAACERALVEDIPIDVQACWQVPEGEAPPITTTSRSIRIAP